MEPVRLLYLPNENERGEQVAPRAFFEGLEKSGRINLRIFSFLVEEKSLGRVGMFQRGGITIRRSRSIFRTGSPSLWHREFPTSPTTTLDMKPCWIIL